MNCNGADRKIRNAHRVALDCFRNMELCSHSGYIPILADFDVKKGECTSRDLKQVTYLPIKGDAFRYG